MHFYYKGQSVNVFMEITVVYSGNVEILEMFVPCTSCGIKK